MPNVVILTQPNTYSPTNGEIWWRLGTTASISSQYKYVFNLNKIDEITGLTTSLGRYMLNPRPITYDAVFSPSKILKANLTYDFMPNVIGLTACPNSIIKYNIVYGFEYNPNIKFADTFSYGGKLGLTFSSNHDLQTGDLIYINKDDKTLNAPYDGTASVTSVINTKSFVTDVNYMTKSANPETGYIDYYYRVGGTSSSYYGFNGTRQYDQVGLDLGSKYIQSATSSKIGNTYSLTNWQPVKNYTGVLSNDLELGKTIYDGEYETRHYLIDNSLYPITHWYVITYDSNKVEIDSNYTTYEHYITHEPNSLYHRIELGTGLANLNGQCAFSGAAYYEVGLGSGTASNLKWGVNYYKIKNNCSPWNPIRLCWLNRLGGFDYFTFNWKNKNTINIERKQYKQNLPWNYTIGMREDTILSQTSVDSYTISSDFISEVEAEWLKELYSSKEVYWLKGTDKYPIIITDNSYEVKRTLTEKMIAVSVNFKMAYANNI